MVRTLPRRPSLGLGLGLVLILAAWPAPLAFAAQFTVAGSVHAPDGEPLAGARVELSPLASNYGWAHGVLGGGLGPAAVTESTTDGDGRFEVVAPSAGVWTLGVEAPGRVPMRYAPLPVADALELPPVTLPADAGVEVTVVDGEGRPAAGIAVMALSASRDLWRELAADGWRSAARVGRGDGEGRLVLPRAPGEQLRVVGLAPGSLELASAGGEGEVTLILPKTAGPRTLEIRDASGRPIPRVIVAVGDVAWPAGETGDDGRLELAGGGSEPIEIHLFGAEGRRQLHRWAPAADGAHEIRWIEPWRSAGRLRRGSGRQPLAGALVWPTHDPGRFAVTAEDGSFELAASSDGGFWARIQARGFSPRGLRIDAPAPEGRPQTVTLDPSVVAGGRVVDASGRPVAGVALAASSAPPRRWKALPRDPADSRTVSDEEGRFALTRLVPDGSYRLDASKPGFADSRIRLDAPGEGTTEGGLEIVLTRARSAHGGVIDGEDRPVAGAEVALRATSAGTSGAEPVTATTDGHGRFSVASAPGPRIDVAVRRAGYAPMIVRGVELPPRADTESADLGTLRLMPAAVIEGQVTSPDGEPVAGAGVWVVAEGRGELEPSSGSEAAATRTAANGRFRIGELEAGRPVDLRVDREGYLPEALHGVTAPTVEPLAIVLETASTVRGRVVDEAGWPLAGARVRLADPEPEPGTVGVETRRRYEVRTGVTDADGELTLIDVAPGPAELTAELDGYQASGPVRIEVPAASAAEAVELVLRRGGIVEGQVTGEAGEPIPEVRLSVGEAETLTDADGFFRLTGVKMGYKLLVARHLEFERYEEALEVGPGGVFVDVSLAAGRTVSGRVVAEDGTAVPGARVELRLDPTRGEIRRYAAASDPDGVFELPRVVDGVYDAVAEAAGHGVLEARNAVRVAGEPVAGVELTLPAEAAVAGRLLGLEFEELARAKVEAVRDGTGRPGIVDFQGRYQVAGLSPGVWRLRAWLPGGGRQVEGSLTLEPHQRLAERDLRFGGLTLAGSVTHGGDPLPGTSVLLTGHEAAVRRSVTSDFEGRFRLTDLPAGHYRLAVADRARALTHHQELELAADREVTVEIATARLAGEVVSAADARPLADAMVLVHQQLGGASSEPAALTTVATDRQGRFTVARLSAGDYRLSVRADGHAPAERQLRLAPGEQREALLELSPTEGLELHLSHPRDLFVSLVQLSVLDAAGRQVLSETRAPGAAGVVRFPTVPTGAWHLLVSAPGAAVTRAQAVVPGPPLELALTPATELDVRVPVLMAENLVADLTLTTPDGRPFLGFGPRGTPQDRFSLPAGSGRLAGVPPGVWILEVAAADGRAWQRTIVTEGGQGLQVVME